MIADGLSPRVRAFTDFLVSSFAGAVEHID
jgi:hypothetical protein